MAGYSGTPLPKKLGLKPAHRVALLARSGEIDLDPTRKDLPSDLDIKTTLRGSKPFDLILLPTDKSAEMIKLAEKAAPRLTPAGMLWLAWPKKASGVPTDLSDGAIREIGLSLGLVDNKTCAIDEVWSGLRFVRRINDR